MKKYKAIVTYKGTGFYGWQRQKDKKSIQSIIERTFQHVFKKTIPVKASGRTDSGVHGLSQTISFEIDTKMDATGIKNALNSKLKKQDVYIKKLSTAKITFHPRYDAKGKIYRYLISRDFSPFLKNLAWLVRTDIDIEKMKKVSECLIGKHDFSSFCSTGSSAKSHVREIYRIRIKKERFTMDPNIKLLSIEIYASGFLYKMARTIVGTLVDVGRGRLSPEDVKKILESKDRKKASQTAPGYGLYLKKVYYNQKVLPR
ncbi:MAG: tRNA pseudouridine(38-40) synthase TruA [Candidatus Omnitrophica bacterium]|nr:tRNA pseudouridine(38-40) synthase TruA [Candidatus Omnitrophota bacterium]